MNLHLNIPRPSTILLCGLLLALYAASPVPLAVTVAVVTWALHTPAALALSIVAVLAYKLTHPKAVR